MRYLLIILLLCGCSSVFLPCTPGNWCDNMDYVLESNAYSESMGSRRFPYVHYAGIDVVEENCYPGATLVEQSFIMSRKDQMGCLLDRNGEWHIYTLAYTGVHGRPRAYSVNHLLDTWVGRESEHNGRYNLCQESQACCRQNWASVHTGL
jgi:hypothetical protein